MNLTPGQMSHNRFVAIHTLSPSDIPSCSIDNREGLAEIHQATGRDGRTTITSTARFVPGIKIISFSASVGSFSEATWLELPQAARHLSFVSRYRDISGVLPRVSADRGRSYKPGDESIAFHRRSQRRRLEISSGKSQPSRASFVWPFVGWLVLFAPAASSSFPMRRDGGIGLHPRQTFRVRPFPTACIMHAAAIPTATTTRRRRWYVESPLYTYTGPASVGQSV